MEDNTKYPRTYHLPFSSGATSDDKKLGDDYFDLFCGKEVVITEKLDGENSALTRENVYSRSHAVPTRSPWSVNLWGNTGIHWRIKDAIGSKEILYGENLYGIHSIEYSNLPAYFFLFAVRDDKRWYSWNEIVEYSAILNIPTVPELYRGTFKDQAQFERTIENLATQPSAFGDTREGVVVRVADEFPIVYGGEDNFRFNVAKYVRANHVQTDEHWTRNWKRAELKL
jgi:hypothetical protein